MPAPIGIAHYFTDICLDVFETLMTKQGFVCKDIDEIGGVLFTKNELFLEITYLPDTVPYVSAINCGYYYHSDNMKIRKGIGIWYVIPESLADDYNLWRFSSPDELRNSLSRLRDEVLLVYGQQFWQNPKYLKESISLRENELLEAEKKKLKFELKEKAEKAFRAGAYEETLSLYAKLDKSDLSPAELKRLEIAKSKIRR